MAAAALVADHHHRPRPRRRLRHAVPHRHQPRDRRDPDRSARGRHDAAVGRHPGARRQGRHRQAPEVGRDARLDVGDLLRQDRHAHAQPDDGARSWSSSVAASASTARGTRRRAGSSASAAPGGVGDQSLEDFMLPMALANDAVIRDGACIGDPTEGALVVLAAKGGLDVEETRSDVAPCRRGAVRRRVQADGDVPRHRGPARRAVLRQGRARRAPRPIDAPTSTSTATTKAIGDR